MPPVWLAGRQARQVSLPQFDIKRVLISFNLGRDSPLNRVKKGKGGTAGCGAVRGRGTDVFGKRPVCIPVHPSTPRSLNSLYFLSPAPRTAFVNHHCSAEFFLSILWHFPPSFSAFPWTDIQGPSFLFMPRYFALEFRLCKVKEGGAQRRIFKGSWFKYLIVKNIPFNPLKD